MHARSAQATAHAGPSAQPVPHAPDDRIWSRTQSERMLIWAFRRTRHGATSCFETNRSGTACRNADGTELCRAISALMTLPGQRGSARTAEFRIAPQQSLTVTADEQALLAAIAAAQCGDDRDLAAHLLALGVARTIDPALEAVITRIAACLATDGHWLTEPPLAPTPH